MLHHRRITKMKFLIKKHRELLNDLADRFGLSAYQIVWIAFGKGLLIGYLVGEYL
jgi:hypothetical protein